MDMISYIKFAGTYGNFGAALRVNPWDTQEVADAIYEALVMNEEDKTYRWKNLYSYVTTNTGNSEKELESYILFF